MTFKIGHPGKRLIGQVVLLRRVTAKIVILAMPCVIVNTQLCVARANRSDRIYPFLLRVILGANEVPSKRLQERLPVNGRWPLKKSGGGERRSDVS